VSNQLTIKFAAPHCVLSERRSFSGVI